MRSHDGANLLRTGFFQWVEQIQHAFDIPDYKIVFNTITAPEGKYMSHGAMLERYPWQKVGLKAFLHAAEDINKAHMDVWLADAKFVGALAAGRWSPWRLRMIYELDRAFPGDTYITHNKDHSLFLLSNGAPEADQTKEREAYPDFVEECKWLKEKTFEVDPNVDPQNVAQINYRKAYKFYHSIWNKFRIEVALETDEYQSEWFTDKVGKCLASGKPFVLLAGPDSLKNLKKLGFNTFDKWIDESYDQCRHPAQRIKHIVASLAELHKDGNHRAIINEMDNVARENVEIFKHYVQSQI